MIKTKRIIKSFICIIVLFILSINLNFLLSSNLQAKPPSYNHWVIDGDKLHCEMGGTELKCGPVSLHIW